MVVVTCWFDAMFVDLDLLLRLVWVLVFALLMVMLRYLCMILILA